MQTVRRIANEILGVKGLITSQARILIGSCSMYNLLEHRHMDDVAITYIFLFLSYKFIYIYYYNGLFFIKDAKISIWMTLTKKLPFLCNILTTKTTKCYCSQNGISRKTRKWFCNYYIQVTYDVANKILIFFGKRGCIQVLKIMRNVLLEIYCLAWNLPCHHIFLTSQSKVTILICKNTYVNE